MSPAPSRFSNPHLATRLIAAFVAIILIATLAAGVPAYLLIRSELERQAWSRVQDAHRVTGTLLTAEKSSLTDLVRLTAERPTLQRLLSTPNSDELREYLATLQTSVDLDILIVSDLDGNHLAGSEIPIPDENSVFAEIALVDVDQAAIVATRAVTVVETGEIVGYVTGGILIDDPFMRRLAAETGLDQSLLLDGRRTATSLRNHPDAPPVDLLDAILTTSDSGQREAIFPQGPYYTVLSPLTTPDGEAIAVLETALPVSSVVDAHQRALLVLGLSTLGVTLLGWLFATFFARRLTAPLRQLTHSAQAISHGDFTTPIPQGQGTAEIATLAAALEESRQNTHRTLNELSVSKAWTENLIGSINEGVVTFDTRGFITFFSEGAERILGCPRDAMLGQQVEEVFRLAEDSADGFLAYIPPRGGKQEISVLRPDGRPVTLTVSGARLVPPHGDDVQVVLVFRDVTEEEASRNLRAYFLANITHEFRTPLAALTASIELLVDEAERIAHPNLSELTASLYLSIINLRTLIDNLLESSSIEAGRFIIRRRAIDLNEVVVEAIRVVQPLLDRRQQSLSVSEPVRLFRLEADPNRLLQVLINLLSNASKYSPSGSTIDVTVEIIREQLRVSIADRGPGIASADRANLFRRFMRVGAASAEQYGIGLGLSVAKAIMDGHGGEIGVDERTSGGSVFWFTLPLDIDFSKEQDV